MNYDILSNKEQRICTAKINIILCHHNKIFSKFPRPKFFREIPTDLTQVSSEQLAISAVNELHSPLSKYLIL